MTMLGPNGIRDTAHCKIASDLLSSLFLVCAEYRFGWMVVSATKKTQEKRVSMGRYLKYHSFELFGLSFLGNFPLVRVVPQIYPENREPFHAHLPQLLKLLQNMDTDQSERLSILQFASMVANAKPDVCHSEILLYLKIVHEKTITHYINSSSGERFLKEIKIYINQILFLHCCYYSSPFGLH
uniref:Uncharacterized protein n=1 Tax=Parascaris equorum TaxID=6256 RepID=A0A914R5T0_PAREQ